MRRRQPHTYGDINAYTDFDANGHGYADSSC
jgi:hypothetical protein